MAAAQQNGAGEEHAGNAQVNALSEKREQEISQPPNGEPKGPESQDKDKKQASDDEKKDDGPAGGFDDSSAPRMPQGTVGYKIKITMHKATD